MAKITIEDYFMNRTQKYPCSEEVRDNAKELLIRANKLLEILSEAKVPLEYQQSFGLVASGWRPAELNAATPNASPRSNHIIGCAVDIYDPDGLIDDWIMEHPSVLDECGLYMEHPSATKGWCHVAWKPPKSGKRIFYP